MKQNVTPLNTVITKFGHTRPAGGPQAFRVLQITIGTASFDRRWSRDHFAPSQFRDMSDDVRLSSPSFELLPAGVTVAAHGADCGLPVPAAADFEDIVIPSPPAAPRTTSTVPIAVANRFAEWSAVGLSDLSRLGANRYRARRSGSPRKRRRSRCPRRSTWRRHRRRARSPPASRPRTRWARWIPCGEQLSRWSPREGNETRGLSGGGPCNTTLPAMGAARRRGRYHDAGFAGAGPARRCRTVGRGAVRELHGAGQGREAVRAGRCDRDRSAPDRARPTASPDHQLRIELLSADRIRPARFPVALHAGKGRRGGAPATVDLPDRREKTSRRDPGTHGDVAVAGAGDRRCGELAAELPNLDDSWAWAHAQVVGSPGDTARDAQARDRKRAGAYVVAVDLSAAPGPGRGLHRLCRPGIRSRTKGGTRLARAGRRAHATRAGLDLEWPEPATLSAARVPFVGIHDRPGRRLRIAGARSEAACIAGVGGITSARYHDIRVSACRRAACSR